MGKPMSAWQKIPVSLAELSIDTTLRCGQSFRWRQIEDQWHCALHGRIVSLRQDSDNLYFRATWPEARAAAATLCNSGDSDDADDTCDFITSYFNLPLHLSALYEQWSRDDLNFRKKAPRFSGVRILNQDVWETLVCFICSSNNNIPRISQMAHKLCLHYGPFIGSINGEAFHDFPSPEALAAPSVEKHLRELGFGYRAKYIAATAKSIATERPSDWLEQLRNADCPRWPGTPVVTNKEATYKYAHESLILLNGVGPKVADCVCLMGLGWGEAVPVDTHMWQIAMRDYKFKASKSKTMSLAMYHDVGDFFRGIWGKHAGWAQSVLFTANLKSFSDRLKEEKPDKSTKSSKRKPDEEDGKDGKDEKDVEVTPTVGGRRKRTHV